MHNTAEPSIDIVIPTRNRGDLLDATLRSIRASEGANLTVWVVDQSDDNRSEVAVARHSAEDRRVRYLRIPPRGISNARNVGVAAGSADVILFTDDDCRVDPAWAREMAGALTGYAAHWAVFGRVLPDEEGQPTQDQVTKGVVLGVKLSEEPAVYVGDRFNLGFGHGASMGVRRDRLAQLGGFDPLLGAGAPLRSYEDRDLGYRIIVAGGSIKYHPVAVVYHRQWRTWEAVRRATADYGVGVGAGVLKCLRLGDLGALWILTDWMLDQGVRQVLSGMIKWRSTQKMTVGWYQITKPWVGIWKGLFYPVDHATGIYCLREERGGATATSAN